MQKLLSDGRVLAAIFIVGVLVGFRTLMGVASFNQAVTSVLNSIAPLQPVTVAQGQNSQGESSSSGFSSFFDSIFDDGAKDGQFSFNRWFRMTIGAGEFSGGSGPGMFAAEGSQGTNSQRDFGGSSAGQGTGSAPSGDSFEGGSAGGGNNAAGGGGGGGSGNDEEAVLVQQNFGNRGSGGGLAPPVAKATTPDAQPERNENDNQQDSNTNQNPEGQGNAPVETPSTIASKEAVQNFQKDAFIDFNAPSSMKFVEVDMDLDNDIATLYGTDHATKTSVALLARRGTAEPDQVKPFLVANDGSIPNLPLSVVQQMGAPTRGQASPGSGLSDPYVWEIQQGATTYVISLMPRADSQGVYLGFVKGPTATFEAAEGYYDGIFNQIKVRK